VKLAHPENVLGALRMRPHATSPCRSRVAQPKPALAATLSEHLHPTPDLQPLLESKRRLRRIETVGAADGIGRNSAPGVEALPRAGGSTRRDGYPVHQCHETGPRISSGTNPTRITGIHRWVGLRKPGNQVYPQAFRVGSRKSWAQLRQTKWWPSLVEVHKIVSDHPAAAAGSKDCCATFLG
jgi:hypothetical protein